MKMKGLDRPVATAMMSGTTARNGFVEGENSPSFSKDSFFPGYLCALFHPTVTD